MRRTVASLGLLVLAGCAALGDPHGLDRFFRAHDDHPVQVAALVVDLDTGETLYAREARRLLRPASTMKVLTTAAFCRRAPDAEIATTLCAAAVPEGEVTLVGGGDPFLSAAEVRELVRELKARGLRRVREGRVAVLDPLAGAPRFGEGWMWDDEPASFMPAMSGAPVDGGCVTVTVAAAGAGLAAGLLPVAGDLQLRVEPGEGRLRVTRGRYRDPTTVTVAGKVEGDQPAERRITVPDPARHTAWVLADALAQEGLLDGEPTIAVGEVTAPPSGAVAVSLRRTIAETVRRTNKASDNLGAELLLRRLATLGEEPVPLGPGATAKGLAVVGEDLAALGLDPDGYVLADGSGVSHYNLISAELLVKELVGMERLGGRAFEVFEQSLPVAGRDGTLQNRMRGTPAEGRVHAKTGTISGVSNLAGYVATRSGRRLAFAVLVQNHVGSAVPWRALQDAFCARLAEL